MKIEFADYKSSDVLTTDVNFYNSGFFRIRFKYEMEGEEEELSVRMHIEELQELIAALQRAQQLATNQLK
jgi:hypothetical protein